MGSAKRRPPRVPAAGVADHVAFGYGIHSCPGQGLAKFEGFAIIEALARRVERFEIIGEPKLALNNMTRSLGSLPVRVRLAA